MNASISITPIHVGDLIVEGEVMPVVVVDTGERPTIIAGDTAVWFGELDEPATEGQLLIRSLHPEHVWITHEHKAWTRQ